MVDIVSVQWYNARMEEKDIRETIERDAKGRLTKEWLAWAYLEKGLSTLKIAEVTGHAPSGIWRWMKQYDIPLRKPMEITREWLEQKYVVEGLSLQEIVELSGARNKGQIVHKVLAYGLPVRRPKPNLIRPTREWLIQKYVEEGLSTKQICAITGYSKNGMAQLLAQYGIERKGWSKDKLDISREELYQLHVVEGLTAVRIAARLGCHNSAISRLIKQYNLDPGRPLVNQKKEPPLTRDELWKLYWVDQLSAGQIAEQYGVGRSTTLRWFKQLDVPTRKWNGGDFQRTYVRTTGDRREYEFNAIERDKILTRDGWKCQMPGCHCKEAWRLEVHHILPVEYGGDNALSNGITLCRDCHESIRRRELDFIPIFREILNRTSN